MNGTQATILLWAINGLLGLIVALIGLLLRAHKERDDERIKEVKEEIVRIRNTLHQWSPHIGWVDQKRRDE